MEIGNVTIHAERGRSVSHGTLRTEDLVPVFMDVLKDTPEYDDLVAEREDIMDIYRFSKLSVWDSFEMEEFMEESLFPVLESYSPKGYMFGAHPGDGSDFGYWRVDDDDDDDMSEDNEEPVVSPCVFKVIMPKHNDEEN